MTRPRSSVWQSAAEWLLRALLGSDPGALAILGDLIEEHGQRTKRGSRGTADWWLLRQAAVIVPYALRERRRRRRRPRLAVMSASPFEGLLQDLRDAVRSLANTKQSSTAAIATMALGIGGATAIFSLVDGILLKPLPFTHQERLVIANELAPGGVRTGVSWLNFQDWKNGLESFDDLAAVQPVSFTLSSADGAERLAGRRVTWNFLRVLGVRSTLGRDFVPEDDRPGAGRVALVSYRFWTDRLGGSTDAIGRTAIVEGEPHVIVGVLPRSFRFGRDDDVYAPIGALIESPPFRDRGDRGPLRAVGRLKPGRSADSARRELMERSAVLARAYPGSNSGFSAELERLDRRLVGDVRLTLVSLFSAAGFLALLACVSVSNLLLARGTRRRRDLAVRSALGASRGRVLRQLLIEHGLICGAAGVSGVALGTTGLGLLLRAAPKGTPRIDEVTVDATVILFAMGLSLVCGMAFGLLPALDASRTGSDQLVRAPRLRVGGSVRTRRLLIGIEVAVAVVLMSGAGLMTRTMTRLLSVDSGFDPNGLLVARLSIPQSWSDDRVRRFSEDLLARVRALPDVIDAGLTVSTPLEGSQWGSVFQINQRSVPARSDFPTAAFNAVTPGYFSTLQLNMSRGRPFTGDDTETSEPVAIINETLARRHWPGGGNPIGQRIKQGWPEWPTPWRTIVGVASDVKLNGVEASTPEQIFFPLSQSPARAPGLIVRAAEMPTSLARPLADAVHALAADVAVYDVRDMPGLLADGLARQRISAMVLGMFALLALILAAIGLYGVVAQSVAERTREIGLRMALGATKGQVLRLVVSPILATILVGVVAGLLGALELCRLIGDLLFEVSPSDPPTYLSVAAVLLASGIAACYQPAHHALSIEPVSALRSD